MPEGSPVPLGRLASYEIVEKLGQGGMGVVFKARDTRLQRFVALKILPESLAGDADARSRLRREARAEASLSHPNIAVCFEIGEAPLEPPDLLGPVSSNGRHEVLFLAMEYIAGTDLLTDVVTRKRRLPEILDFTLQLASGLEAAHRSGVVHRDLKPGNILVTSDGRIKILDFGLAKIIESTLSPESDTISSESSGGRVLGTVAYMSPEQAMGDPVDHRSDLFSLGVVVYQLVTGRIPFLGKTMMETLRARVRDTPQPMARYAADVPEELERIVRKLLAREVSDRYQSAHEVLTDLRALTARDPGGVRKWGDRLIRFSRKRYRWIAAFGVLALASGLALQRTQCSGGRSEAMTLAVLPFVNLTGNPGSDHLCKGIAAGVLSDLVSVRNCNVVSQSASFGFEGREQNLEEISRELGAGAVLEGSVQHEGETVRIDVRLVDTATGYALWSGRFERNVDEVYRLQEDIARQVAGIVSGAFPFYGGKWGRGGATDSPAAYDTYLKAGVHLDDADDPRGADLALDLYRQAAALDPGFALAYAGQSKALSKLYDRTHEADFLKRAETAADQAVRLNPDLLEVRVARAQIYRATGRYADAITEMQAVLSVNPNWDEAHLHLAAGYRDAGDLERAGESFRRAIALRPDYWKNWNALGSLLVRKGDYAGAREAFNHIIRLMPGKNRGYEQLAAVEMLEGRFEEALAAYERLPLPVNDGALASNIGTAHFFAGSLDKAEEFYALAVSLEPRNQVCRQNLGDLYSRSGRKSAAASEYRLALHLVEEQLRIDPEDMETGIQRVVFLAKTGECRAASEALKALQPRLPRDDADCAHMMAKALALCGREAEALSALRRAVELGVPARYIREEDEFQNLRKNPDYVSLVSS